MLPDRLPPTRCSGNPSGLTLALLRPPTQPRVGAETQNRIKYNRQEPCTLTRRGRRKLTDVRCSHGTQTVPRRQSVVGRVNVSAPRIGLLFIPTSGTLPARTRWKHHTDRGVQTQVAELRVLTAGTDVSVYVAHLRPTPPGVGTHRPPRDLGCGVRQVG